MRKEGLSFLLALTLSACSGASLSAGGKLPQGSSKLKDEHAASPSPEEDPKAPGQIPQECELLLNKSREWGFAPEQNWKPASREMALEAAAFFGSFHLVPESTSAFARSWLRELEPANAEAAAKSHARMERAQTCDLSLSHKLLLALLAYPWAKEDRAKAADAFHHFVLNQQVRVSPSMARAVQINVLEKAAKKGYVRVKVGDVAGLRRWFDAENAKGMRQAENAGDPLSQWRLNHSELRVAEEARDRLSRILPLP